MGIREKNETELRTLLFTVLLRDLGVQVLESETELRTVLSTVLGGCGVRHAVWGCWGAAAEERDGAADSPNDKIIGHMTLILH